MIRIERKLIDTTIKILILLSSSILVCILMGIIIFVMLKGCLLYTSDAADE